MSHKIKSCCKKNKNIKITKEYELGTCCIDSFEGVKLVPKVGHLDLKNIDDKITDYIFEFNLLDSTTNIVHETIEVRLTPADIYCMKTRESHAHEDDGDDGDHAHEDDGDHAHEDDGDHAHEDDGDDGDHAHEDDGDDGDHAHEDDGNCSMYQCCNHLNDSGKLKYILRSKGYKIPYAELNDFVFEQVFMCDIEDCYPGAILRNEILVKMHLDGDVEKVCIWWGDDPNKDTTPLFDRNDYWQYNPNQLIYSCCTWFESHMYKEDGSYTILARAIGRDDKQNLKTIDKSITVNVKNILVEAPEITDPYMEMNKNSIIKIE